MTIDVLVVPSSYPATKGALAGSFIVDHVHALLCSHVVGSVDVLSVQKIRRSSPSSWAAYFKPMLDESEERLRILRSAVGPVFSAAEASVEAVSARSVQLMKRLLAGRARPQLIHAHNTSRGGIVAREIAQSLGIPYVITEHSSAFLDGSAQLSWEARRATEDASAIISVSHALRRALERVVPDHAPCEVIGNPVRPEFFSTSRVPGQAGELRLVLIAHLNANKNVDVALEAARILASDFDVKLTIVGDGPLRHSLRQLACSMSIGDRVNFVGELSRSQTVTEIASADAVLSSSDVETFGITIAEALAVGVPVVATDSGGPADIVRRGRDGFIVPRGDAASMALAVVRCMTDLQESSEERRRSAQARFGFEAISRANVSLYQRVLG